MRLEDVALLVRKRMDEMQAAIFNKPPQNFEEFLNRLGVWKGLGDALGIIQNARKDADDD